MNRQPPIGFLEGVAVALTGALGGGAAWVLLRALFAPASALPLLISGLGLGYLLYLLARAPTPVGRVSAVLAWVVLTGVTLALAPALLLAVQLGLLWLVRALYHQHGLVGALADLALWLLGLGGALWAIQGTGSMALAVWTWLLIQALFPLLPGPRSAAAGAVPGTNSPDRFEQALRDAQAGLRRLGG